MHVNDGNGMYADFYGHWFTSLWVVQDRVFLRVHLSSYSFTVDANYIAFPDPPLVVFTLLHAKAAVEAILIQGVPHTLLVSVGTGRIARIKGFYTDN